MAYPRSAGTRRRYRLLLLVLTAVTFMTLDLRSFGPLDKVQSGARTVIDPVRDKVGAVFRPVTDRVEGVNRYGAVKRENEALRKEIDELRGKIATDDTAVRRLAELDQQLELDNFYNFPLVRARVSMELPGNFVGDLVRIDKGKRDGIERNYPVVTAAGLIGIVDEPFDSYSTVRLVSDRSFSVAVRTGDSPVMLAKGTGSLRSLQVYSVNELSQLRDKEANLSNCEKPAVYVTYNGPKFPGDIPIGTSCTVRTKGESVDSDSAIKLFANLSALDTVAVLIYKVNG